MSLRHKWGLTFRKMLGGERMAEVLQAHPTVAHPKGPAGSLRGARESHQHSAQQEETPQAELVGKSNEKRELCSKGVQMGSVTTVQEQLERATTLPVGWTIGQPPAWHTVSTQPGNH